MSEKLTADKLRREQVRLHARINELRTQRNALSKLVAAKTQAMLCPQYDVQRELATAWEKVDELEHALSTTFDLAAHDCRCGVKVKRECDCGYDDARELIKKS